MGRVFAQVEQAGTPIPTQTCVHIDDEELQVVQDERDVYYLPTERCCTRAGDGNRDPEDKVRIEFRLVTCQWLTRSAVVTGCTCSWHR